MSHFSNIKLTLIFCFHGRFTIYEERVSVANRKATLKYDVTNSISCFKRVRLILVLFLSVILLILRIAKYVLVKFIPCDVTKIQSPD